VSKVVTSRVKGWTQSTRRTLMMAVVLGLALVAASVSVTPISAQASTTRTTHLSAGNPPPHVIPGNPPAMYCGMPNAPKVIPGHIATRAEAEADEARFRGKAAAAAIGDNFVLASPKDVVQGTKCYGGNSVYGG
jgi:hypothetical protein